MARPGRRACDIVTAINWLDLQGVVNMRDLGGLPTRLGAGIKPRRLLRSDNLQELSPTDIRHLVAEVGVTDVVDLRSTTEVDAEGPGPLSGLAHVSVTHLSLVRDVNRAATAEDTLVLARRGVDVSDPAYWTNHYLGYLSNRPESVVAALRAIAAADGGTIVHCAAGKDRTGTVVGLALAVAGVPEDVIVADYVATGERMQRIIDRLKVRPSYRELLTSNIEDQLPRAATMEKVFSALETEYGGPEGWLAQHGWTDDDSSLLRAKLVG